MPTGVAPPAPTTLAGWLEWMESHHPRAIELGLDRVAAVLRRLPVAAGAVPVISVAGTNGKGSCVAAAVAALRTAGYRVGSYTSPHLVRYNERVCINGQPLDDAALCRAFEAVYAASRDISLTYFEFGTLAALVNFSDAEVDVLVLEVGLGGRLDAVNIVDPDVAVITSIDLDHSDWLGDDREAIGAEKSGIARAGQPLLCADQQPPASIAAVAAATGATLLLAGPVFGATPDPANDPAAADCGNRYRYYGRTSAGECWDIRGPAPQLPAGSVACALQAVSLLDIPVTSAMVEAASGATLPGRFQRADCGGIEIILDVAHNPAAASLLAQRLSTLPAAPRTAVLFGAMADKDVAGVVRALRGSVDAWFLAELKGVPRALAATELAATIHAQNIHMISVSKNLRQAWRRALSLLSAGDRLVVCGSFHVVGPVLSWLDDPRNDRQRSDHRGSDRDRRSPP